MIHMYLLEISDLDGNKLRWPCGRNKKLKKISMEKHANEDAGFASQTMHAYEHSIANMIYSQAIFFGQALHAEDPDNAKFAAMLAKALYMDGQVFRAADLLEPYVTEDVTEDGQLPYLYAKCCYDLGKYNEAITALFPMGKPRSSMILESATGVANGSAGFLLLGRCLERTKDITGAIDAYSKSLELSPYMFESFERISVLSLETSKASVSAARFSKSYFNPDAFSSVFTGVVSHVKVHARPPQAPSRIPATPPRASRRVMSPPSISKPSPRPVEIVPRARNSGLCTFLQLIGGIVHALNSFDCEAVLALVACLPPHHQESLLVQGLLGRAYSENGQFKEAETCFSNALRISSAGIVDFIDIYSSVLWQLKKESELAHLCAHSLRVAVRAKSYKLWIAIANGFSLQQDSESAIKFLNRSLQINPLCAYTHTLLGHEYFSVDKFDKAKQSYAAAIEHEPRCYQGFWGLGQVFQRQEEYAHAKFNFIKALEINPKSSTVRFALGSVAMAMRETDLAYQQLQIAADLNPNNAPAFCQKGMLEFSVYRKTPLARISLERALTIAPKEPAVYVLLGKVYATIPGMRTEAMTCFNSALELLKGAKDSFGIKQCIEDLV